MNKTDLESMSVKVKNHYGEDYQIVAWIVGKEGSVEWECAHKLKISRQRVDNIRYKNEQTKKVDSLKIIESEKVIALKNSGNLYYADDYPIRSIAIRNNLSGKIMLVSPYFKFVNKKSNNIGSRTRESGVIRSV